VVVKSFMVVDLSDLYSLSLWERAGERVGTLPARLTDISVVFAKTTKFSEELPKPSPQPSPKGEGANLICLELHDYHWKPVAIGSFI